MKTIDQTF